MFFSNHSLSVCLSKCKENRGIYSTFHLDKVLNISALLNISLVSQFICS